MSTATVLLLLAAVGSVACAGEQGDGAAPPAAATAVARAAQAPRTPADVLLAVMPALRDSITLGAFRTAHGGDRGDSYRPSLGGPDSGRPRGGAEPWCTRSSLRIPIGSGLVPLRTAYFFPPTTPSFATLPRTSDTGELVDDCRLGLVWIDVAATAHHPATDLARDAAVELADALGPADTTVGLGWSGSAGWRGPAFWRAGNRTAIALSTSGVSWGPGGTAEAPRAIVAGLRDGVGLSFERAVRIAPDTLERHRRAGRNEERVNRALAIAGAGPDAEHPLRSFTASLGWIELYDRLLDNAEAGALDNALTRLLEATASLPPVRRAAALLAADLVLVEFASGTRIGDPVDPGALARRERLAELGAAFRLSPLGAVYVYTRDWLKQARALDPDGPAGELAFLTLMELGFETSGMCADQRGRGFRAVIEHGGAYLREHPNSAIRADVHFLIAQAHADIVALAAGGGYSPEESAEYEPAAPAARTRALEHFRLGFAEDSVSTRARAVWPTAWRLSAGIPPARTFFYCVYD